MASVISVIKEALFPNKSTEMKDFIGRLYVDGDESAVHAMESYLNYSLFRDFFKQSKIVHKEVEFPNGRSLVCKNLQDGATSICLHDNDGTIIDLNDIRPKFFGSPESVAENAFLQNLSKGVDKTKGVLTAGIVFEKARKALDTGEHQVIALPNGKVLAIAPADKDEKWQDVTILLFSRDWDDKIKLYADPDNFSFGDLPLKSLSDVQKYFNKVSETRHPVQMKGLIERTMNETVHSQQVKNIPFPDGSSLRFIPETLSANGHTFPTVRIELMDSDGHPEKIMFKESIPNDGNLSDIKAYGSIKTVQWLYEQKTKKTNSLDAYIEECKSDASAPVFNRDKDKYPGR